MTNITRSVTAFLMASGFAFSASASVLIQSDTLLTGNNSSGKQYRVLENDRILYQADVRWSTNAIELIVYEGHASQKGSLLINDEQVIAYDTAGKELWVNKRGELPLCLPELFPEFAKAHMSALQSGKSIKCLGPVLKAKKLAPFKFSIKQQTETAITVEVGPGSIGMAFFMDALEFTIDANAEKMTAFSGILPAPQDPNGKMRYLEVSNAKANDYPIASINASMFE